MQAASCATCARSSRAGTSRRTSSGLPWHEPGWFDEVAAWIEAALPLSGEPELLRSFAWATVVRAPTEDGYVFFKASAPAHAFEPPLTLLMAQLRPDCTPEVVAADVERAWLLTRDAGRPLAELLHENPNPRLVDEALALYADLQVAAAAHVEEALRYGTPDARPARLRPQYDTVVADGAILAVGGPGGVTPAEQERLIALAPHVDELVERLGDTVPASVAHEEVHEANTFVHDGRIRILDWADASVGHPFASLTGPIRSYGWRFGVEPGDPLLDRFRDAYLEPWTTLAGRADLVDVFAAAYQLGMVSRILSYANSLRSLDAATHAAYVQDMTLWLRVWLAANDGAALLGI